MILLQQDYDKLQIQVLYHCLLQISIFCCIYCCKSKTDDGEQLVWLPLEEIALQEIKPTFLKENINNIINEKNIIHIIEERDR